MEKFWLAYPEAHDFSAAADYLDLLVAADQRAMYIDQLKTAPLMLRRATDLLRAAELPVLKKNDPDVMKNLKKLKKHKKISPILLVRINGKLVIADGYHRISAAYHMTEDLEVPCLLI